MRAGPQLGVAKAARAPPCTLPILGRRFYSPNNDYSSLIPQVHFQIFYYDLQITLFLTYATYLRYL